MGNDTNSEDLTVQSQVFEKASPICPVCACALQAEEELHVCSDCETHHHKDCWDYTGGCAIFGCRKGVLRKFEEGRRRSHLLTAFNLKLMYLWGKLIHADFILFLLGFYAFFGFALTVIGGLYAILTIHLAPFLLHTFIAGSAISFLYFYCSAPFIVFLLVAAAGWCIIYLPLLVMKAHFWIFDLSLGERKVETAMEVAARIELPENLVALLMYVHLLSCKVFKIAMIVSFFYSAMLMIGILIAHQPMARFIPAICLPAFVSLLYFVCLPETLGILQSKIMYVSAFQNRLIASVKHAKH